VLRQVSPTITSVGKRSRVYRWRHILSRTALYLALISWAVITAFPFVWLVLTSLKFPAEVFANPLGLPKEWVFKNYWTAWTQAGVPRLALNSLYVALTSTVIAMFVAATSSFALSRFTFSARSPVFGYIMLGFMVPGSVLLVPLAVATRRLGLYDNLFGLAIVYAAIGVPWNVFFLTAFMQTIPKELEEAAVLDGAGMWRVFWSVILPLSRPGLVTLATLHVLSSWNEFILALLLTISQANRTLPVGMSLLVAQFYANYPALAAAVVMSLIPSILFFLFLQRYVVEGLSAGALVGL
jgi:raffinose/stachyose/melibiose transport system permease protein